MLAPIVLFNVAFYHSIMVDGSEDGLRVAFLGNDPWSVPPLEALGASRHQVVAVLTRSPRPAGRGHKPRATPVADAARRLGLPLHEVETVKDGSGFEALAAPRPDALAVVAYGEILPAAVLAAARWPVNLHFSLLPELRGAAPVQRAILNGLARTGATTILMDEGMDTGDVVRRRATDVEEGETAGELGLRLAGIGGEVLVETLDALAAGEAKPEPQDGARASFAPKLSPQERVIDWSKPGPEIVRRVRAFSPEPGAMTRFRGRGLKILQAGLGTHRGPMGWSGPAMAVPMRAGERDWLGVGAAAGGLVLLGEVVPEGRRPMSGAEFARGARIRPGERLG